MLSVARVRAGGERYYFSTVAATTDLPNGLIEPDPRWAGSLAASLGLTGTPGLEEVRAVLRGAYPGRNERLYPRERHRANLAIDLTFSTPKSVSLLHGLGPEQAAHTARRAHDEAVEATLGYLEREVLAVGRYEGGARRLEAVDGALAVMFVHRVSRALDPHLHTHVLVCNLGRSEEGSFSALDSRRVYRAKKTVRALYEAHLRAGLSEAGIELGELRRDYAEIEALSPDARGEFSRQSAAIAAALSAERLPGSAGGLVARAIRPAKDRSRSYEELQSEWRERGHYHGLSDRRLAEAGGGPPMGRRSEVTDEALVISKAGRESRDGTFGRAELLTARCSSARLGVKVDTAERDVDALIASRRLCRWDGRYMEPALAAELREASEKLAVLGRETGAQLLSYGAGERLAVLEAVHGEAARRSLSDENVLALSPGLHAAAGFEAATGVCSLPVAEWRQALAELKEGSLLVVSDCASLSHSELLGILDGCAEKGARPLLFSSSRTLSSSLACSRLEPLEKGCWPLRSERGLSPSRACERALLVARAAARSGRQVGIVAPDKALSSAIRGLNKTGPLKVAVRIYEPSESALHHARVPLVVIGEPRLSRVQGKEIAAVVRPDLPGRLLDRGLVSRSRETRFLSREVLGGLGRGL